MITSTTTTKRFEMYAVFESPRLNLNLMECLCADSVHK